MDDCFRGLLSQNILDTQCVEVSIYNDSSTDETEEILYKWRSKLKNNLQLKITISSGHGMPRGGEFQLELMLEKSCFKSYLFTMLVVKWDMPRIEPWNNHVVPSYVSKMW